MTKEEILQAIKKQEEYMYIKEMSDDMYYTCGSYTEDKRKLNQLKDTLKNLQKED
jgi:phosphoribosyl-ATP pyrophosphohydrolase